MFPCPSASFNFICVFTVYGPFLPFFLRFSFFFTLFLDFDSPSNYSNVMSIEFPDEKRLTHLLQLLLYFRFSLFPFFWCVTFGCTCFYYKRMSSNVKHGSHTQNIKLLLLLILFVLFWLVICSYSIFHHHTQYSSDYWSHIKQFNYI